MRGIKRMSTPPDRCVVKIYELNKFIHGKKGDRIALFNKIMQETLKGERK